MAGDSVGTSLALSTAMTPDSPYPNTRHETEDWENEPRPQPDTSEIPDPADPPLDHPRDPESSKIADFEDGNRRSPGGVEREQESDSQSKF